MPDNFREKANFIRQVADDTLRVRGAFKAHEFKDLVIKQFEQFKDSLDEERLTPILRQAAGEN